MDHKLVYENIAKLVLNNMLSVEATVCQLIYDLPEDN